jgi:membrane protein required for colicin V production
VNMVDIILLILLVPPVLLGWKFGLIRSVLGGVALIISIVLASRFYILLADSVFDRVFQQNVAIVLSFVVIFVFVFGAMAIVIVRLDNLVTASILNWVNKLGGAVFGLLIGSIILGALLVIITKFFGDQDFITESAIASFMVNKFPLVMVILPNSFNGVRSFFNVR